MSLSERIETLEVVSVAGADAKKELDELRFEMGKRAFAWSALFQLIESIDITERSSGSVRRFKILWKNHGQRWRSFKWTEGEITTDGVWVVKQSAISCGNCSGSGTESFYDSHRPCESCAQRGYKILSSRDIEDI